MSFKSHISYDPTGVLASWNQTLHHCNWSGVTCGQRHPDRVVILKLINTDLVGSITPEIGNLSFLWKLHLSDNKLHGQIPQQLGRLFRLQQLGLDFNSLEGEIPSTLGQCSRLRKLELWGNQLVGKIPSSLPNCSELVYLSLGNNTIGGEIPPNIGSLTKLDALALNRNHLVGSIPPSLGNLSLLTYLQINNNALTGTIPSSLGNLRNVRSFVVEFNLLSGTIPSSVYNLTSMEALMVNGNQIHGTLPRDVAFFTHNFVILDMYLNNLSGSIPTSLCNASNLQMLQLSHNQFSGIIPPCVGVFQDLKWLGLDFNQFEATTAKDWSFFNSLTNCSSLQHLHLNDNRFEGVLPQTLSNLSLHLRTMLLGGSGMSGTIPEGIGNFINMTDLEIRHTNIGGEIPNSIGKLQLLNELDLSRNQLVGQIPFSFYNLTNLNRLNLDGNRLQAKISNRIGDMQNLGTVYLSNNDFYGSIPEELFSIKSITTLDLSHNNFIGPFSSNVGNLKFLVHMGVSNNRLSGSLPNTLGDCIMLTELLLQNNQFEGVIPTTVENLKSLETLDLSQNHLSGGIPKLLGKLVFLKNLNLSYNDLEGEVPTEGVFVNASSNFLLGNKILCGGPPRLHLPTCSSNTLQSKRKHKVNIVVFATLSGLLLVLGIMSLCYWKPYFMRKKSSVDTNIVTPENSFARVTYADLFKSTNGFSSSNWIGAGGFGSVYTGIVESIGIRVAIKVFNLQQRGALKSFMAECETLKNIRHRNLVKILTTCSSIDFKGNDFKALVYEFIPNGNLDMWLHSETNEHGGSSRTLTLIQRLNIAIDVATALDYLHCHGSNPIIHCDLKPSNILLDDDMKAYVGDFGLAKILLTDENELSRSLSSSLAIKGTVGYIPPEYGIGFKVSIHGDVFSYGILLLEMITGKKPTDDDLDGHSSLYKLVEGVFPHQIWNIVDPKLLPRIEVEEADGDTNGRESTITKVQECLVSMIQYGLLCSKESPTERINMKGVLTKITATRSKFLATAAHEIEIAT